MQHAQFYTALPDGVVSCWLCRHRCRIMPGGRGVCRVRENRGGKLYSLVYGMLVAEHVDPIEKKPLFHYLPGTTSYSIASIGCNFHCLHCQNATIAQVAPSVAGEVPGRSVAPAQVVASAVAAGCASIAYTYTEPTVWGEYVLDVARLARQAGLKNILVTNGYITPEALDILAPYLDAANIDLKGFSDDFYQRVVGARRNEVLACIKDYYQRGIWIELTTLVIPGENDAPEQLEGIAVFIAGQLSPHIPWHISRFFPHYRMSQVPVTPLDSLVRAEQYGRQAGLRHLYVGNCREGNETTRCPVCGADTIVRQGFEVVHNRLVDGSCQHCGTTIAGIWR